MLPLYLSPYKIPGGLVDSVQPISDLARDILRVYCKGAQGQSRLYTPTHFAKRAAAIANRHAQAGTTDVVLAIPTTLVDLTACEIRAAGYSPFRVRYDVETKKYTFYPV